jgi:hypothetical protein
VFASAIDNFVISQRLSVDAAAALLRRRFTRIEGASTA